MSIDALKELGAEREARRTEKDPPRVLVGLQTVTAPFISVVEIGDSKRKLRFLRKGVPCTTLRARSE
jgi:hypothetical protein